MTCQNVGGTVLTAISDSDKPQDHLGDPPSTSMTDEVLIRLAVEETVVKVLQQQLFGPPQSTIRREQKEGDTLRHVAC